MMIYLKWLTLKVITITYKFNNHSNHKSINNLQNHNLKANNSNINNKINNNCITNHHFNNKNYQNLKINFKLSEEVKNWVDKERKRKKVFI